MFRPGTRPRLAIQLSAHGRNRPAREQRAALATEPGGGADPSPDQLCPGHPSRNTWVSALTRQAGIPHTWWFPVHVA